MMAFFGLLYLLPIAWSLAVQDGAVIDFVAAALINAFVGLAVAARHAALPARAQAARRIPARHAVVGADVGVGRRSR